MSKPKNELSILVNKVKNMFNAEKSLEKMTNMKTNNNVTFNNIYNYNHKFTESNYMPIISNDINNVSEPMPEFISDDIVVNSFLTTLGILGIYILYRVSSKQ